MQTSIYQYANNEWISCPLNQIVLGQNAQLVICFARKKLLKTSDVHDTVKSEFPNAIITFCSTAGEIFHDQVYDDSFVVIAMEFKNTPLTSASVNIKDFANRYDAAITLANQFELKDLSYLMVFSDGSLVNGSELVKGLNTVIPKNVLITGGLAGDGADFTSTLVGLNKQPTEGEIVAIGFYGKNLVVTHGSHGGWDIFGLEKRITKSVQNVLYEIENQNALELYKKYLGKDAAGLPGSALLFPLHVTIPGSEKSVVRTILSIDEDNQSMTFAGDVPEGSKVRFMKANFEHLTNAASTAATQCINHTDRKPDFALLISCVGRKLILGAKTHEEVKAINNTFQNKTLLAGFYSYGEISPFSEGGSCQLHNQTMTVTAFYEN